MAKIKLTKGELKKQRDSLKQFRHYLPTLQLKKQQLQMKILEARKALAEQEKILQVRLDGAEEWAPLLADPRVDLVHEFDSPEQVACKLSGVDLRTWITPATIAVQMVNVAGANVPVFQDIHFPPAKYDLYTTPFWLDRGLEELRLLVSGLVEMEVIRRQIKALEKELRITTQRVNLFEKVKIPECQENIRVICIYLGDQQANAVGVSKVAKRKLESREEEGVLA